MRCYPYRGTPLSPGILIPGDDSNQDPSDTQNICPVHSSIFTEYIFVLIDMFPRRLVPVWRVLLSNDTNCKEGVIHKRG